MNSIKEIKARIKSIEETAQITHAMELISGSKMQKASQKYRNNRAYVKTVHDCLHDILYYGEYTGDQYYMSERKGGKTFYVIIGSDKGLAGEYNHTIINYALDEINKSEKREILCIGGVVGAHLAEAGENVQIIDFDNEPTLEDARKLSTELVEKYKAGEMDEIIVLYTKMLSKSYQRPDRIRLLPIIKEDFSEDNKEVEHIRLDFEPNVDSVMSILVPQYILGVLYSCLTESKYSEHLERMRAMNSATKNADELLDNLRLNYNKARQEKITTEITELAASMLKDD